MIRRWLALTYHLYALRLAALSHFYLNPLYNAPFFNRTENMDGLDIGALLALLFGLWLLFQVGKMLFKLAVLAALAMLVWQYLQHAQI